MINNKLYRALRRRFGEDNVQVMNEDLPMEATYSRITDEKDGVRHRLAVTPGGSGEEYKLNCCFCGDTRQRLYVNHRWGVLDTRTQTLNLWLAQCWNEQCLSEYSFQKKLYRMVFTDGGVSIGPSNLDYSGSKRAKRLSLERIRYPGPVMDLCELVERQPDHPAIVYLHDRLYDPSYLSRHFSVGYLMDADLSNARGRIFAPIFMRRDLVGWQARYIGDPPDKSIPKWYTCPGMRKSAVLYNFDVGIRYPTKVIVEGPGDVWGFGPQAMGLLGKTMNSRQRDLLVDGSVDGDTVVLMLDPAWTVDERERGKREHHMDRVYKMLDDTIRFHGKVLRAWLPDNLDPGGADREYMLELIRREADKAKIDVSFKARTASHGDQEEITTGRNHDGGEKKPGGKGRKARPKKNMAARLTRHAHPGS